jgi:hypothetical protein
MNDNIAEARLFAVPKPERQSLLAHRDELPAGAITVINRFFLKLGERGEHPSAPSRATFEAVCRTESTLGLLLRVLNDHLPVVCLAEGRILRHEYYRRRSSGLERSPQRRAITAASSFMAPQNWPCEWLDLLPGLRAAPIKDTSINRYIASVNRCADMAPDLKCPPRLGWLFAWELASEAQKKQGEHGAAINARTAASYIGALVSLGVHGGLDDIALDGLRSVQAHYQRKGRRLAKRKTARIDELYEKGGYDEVMRAIIRELLKADVLPDWSAKAAVARATAAILAVCTNDPARTGDVASWTMGEALVRHTSGRWQLRWRQQKTGHWKDAGELWPEIGAVIDEHILGGRPKRHTQRRFEELRGVNWLTFSDQPYDSRWPSEKVSDALGVPLHDLRTLAADYLRLHNPASAPNVVAVLLGHVTREAGEDYRSLCVETVAQREWLEIRHRHATSELRR